MAETLNWNFVANITGGPTLVGAGALDIEAYVKVNVTVPANDDLDVEILPGAGGALQVLVISPATPNLDLTYDVDGEAISLDGPHVLIGAGAARLLGAAVGTLTFTNGTAEDIDLSILAGRDATP